MSELKDDATSRLLALERMGVVEDYGRIYKSTVIVVGIGGVGAVVAEMLTRCGIGKLILFDYDSVELANMNRLFYTPDHVGLTKVEAATQTLNRINANVLVEGVNSNICSDYEKFQEYILTGGLNGQRVDLVLSCVDNYAARVTINKVCCKLDQTWMNSGVSENAISGQIQTCMPGITACFLCVPPYVVATGGDENKIKRPGVCTASLPTTMSVVAGLLAHNALKYLLAFGSVTDMLTYNSLQDYIPSYSLGCNLECSEPQCVKRQNEKRGQLKTKQAKVEEPQSVAETLHADNEYGIEIVTDTQEKQPQVSATNDKRKVHESQSTSNKSLDELKAKLKGLSMR